MGKINILPPAVYNMISAGEVVERPASVVKELFENAVDAGAKNITVFIERGGLEDIFVSDDGSGITKEDLPKVFLPHATSKLSSEKDLERVLTLGFRGEAIASISAVSECRISSKQRDKDVGYTMTSTGGVIGDITVAPCLDGTSVTVSQLFFNTPARLKFLKNDKSEEREVSSTIEREILANPYVAVKYHVDNKLAYQSFGGGEEDAVLAVYGSDFIDKCYHIKSESNGISVSGYIGNTNFYKSNRTYQTVIVNGRPVEDKTISLAVSNAYTSYLMKRQFPVYVLSIVVPPEIVDVNVHPRKAEVRFSNNQIIYSTIYSIVSRILDGSASALNIVTETPKATKIVLTPKKEGEELDLSAPRKVYDSFSSPFNKKGKPYIKPEDYGFKKRVVTRDYSEPLPPYKLPEIEKKPKTNVADRKVEIKDFTSEALLSQDASSSIDQVFKDNKEYIEKIEKEKAQAEQLAIETELPIRYVGQILKTYLVLERGEEMILIDQHAAHERFLFDRFYETVKTNKVVKQSLIYPFSFKTNAREFDIIYDEMQYFRNIGIDLEAADDNLFKVYSVPVELIDIDYEVFFRDILTDPAFLQEKLPGVLTEKLMQKACKSAIKSGYELKMPEIDALLALLKDNWGLKCPHGRPIAVKVSRTEIDKWFKRIV